MENINYALASGNKTLLKVQAEDKTLAVQFWYSGIVAANVTIEVWVSTVAEGKPYSKIDAATKTLVAGDGTVVITLSGTSFLHVQFRLVTNGVTVGKIDDVEYMAAINPQY